MKKKPVKSNAMYNFGIVGKPNCFVSVTKLNLANEMKNPKEAKNVIYFCKNHKIRINSFQKNMFEAQLYTIQDPNNHWSGLDCLLPLLWPHVEVSCFQSRIEVFP